MKLRVKFSKWGVVKYIGHLDLLRYFQKAFRRTDTRVVYSKGFSPHMLMSFASPLGVGMEGYGEYFDVEVEEGTDPAKVKEQLNNTMAEGIEVLDVIILPDGFGNAMASVAASDYELEFHKANPLTDDLMDAFDKAPAVTFVKKQKSGEVTINVKDYIYEFRRVSDNVIFAKVDSSSESNLRPSVLLAALLSLKGLNIEDYPFHIKRREVYRRNKNGDLVPLGDVNE